MAPIAPVVSRWAVRLLAKLHLRSLKAHLHYRRKKWNGSDKKWNGSAKFSSVNRILSVPFVTGCGPFQERIG